MATMIGMEKNLVNLLKDLIELDFDAIEAYKVAIERLREPTYQERLRKFQEDHERHTQNLSSLVVEMGGTPPYKADVKALLTKGKVYLGNLIGDEGILTAMLSNENDTNTAYERATERTDLPSHAKAILRENLADERRHRAWIEETLKKMKDKEVRPSSNSKETSIRM